MGAYVPEAATAQFSNSFDVNNLEGLAKKFGWARKNERGYEIQEQLFGTEKPIKIIHIGAGVSGICMAKFLPDMLNNATLVCYDKNNDIGGTWLENRYPGCACDIPSVNYQVSRISHIYSF
jgi:predicted O-methyltransferase YrrM